MFDHSRRCSEFNVLVKVFLAITLHSYIKFHLNWSPHMQIHFRVLQASHFTELLQIFSNLHEKCICAISKQNAIAHKMLTFVLSVFAKNVRNKNIRNKTILKRTIYCKMQSIVISLLFSVDYKTV